MQKVGEHEGPQDMSTAAEYMKWIEDDDSSLEDDEDSSEVADI